jgi:hypothetical protein
MTALPAVRLDSLGIQGAIDVLAVRRRLGRDQWGPPTISPDGAAAKLIRSDGLRMIVLSAATYPDDPDRTVWTHASIAVHGPTDIHGPHPVDLPGYDDLVMLRHAVWGDTGWAFQVFAPPSGHVNITQVLHLWGRADGARTHPDFAWLGGI